MMSAESQHEEEELEPVLTPKQLVEKILKNDAVPTIFENATALPLRFNAFIKLGNRPLNRFPSAILYDKTRVVLKDKKGSDYYHASYVDSYDKPHGYILAQAPFNERTEIDFWRLCAQEKPAAILLLGSTQSRDERQRINCFWPSARHERKHPSVNVRTLTTLEERGHNMHTLNVIPGELSAKKGHRLQMIHFTKWMEDKEVPDGLMDLRAVVKVTAAKQEQSADGPILIVCPSGIHRCGTFVTLDVVMDRIQAEKRVGIDQTITVLKSQRYGCITFYEHYKILQEMVINHAITTGLVEPNAVGSRKR